MAFFNYSTMQMTAKIVYYGPGLGGKTTNLQFIYGHVDRGSRGEMVSLETQTDRTLFFDLLPMEVGTVAGFKTRIQLYTVPGQVFYNTTRKLVLKGVDGVVFVADSQQPMMQANIESLQNLAENLHELGTSLDTLPIVMQYNKRDLPEVTPTSELEAALNERGWQAFEASALTGEGVFETLRGISRLTLLSLRKQLEVTPGKQPADRPAAAASAARPVAPPPAAHATAARPRDEDSEPVLEEAASEPEPARLRKDFLLRVPSADLAHTESLHFELRLRDGNGGMIRETKPIVIELEGREDSADVLLQLNLAVRGDESGS